jgi:hypothetical protein
MLMFLFLLIGLSIIRAHIQVCAFCQLLVADTYGEEIRSKKNFSCIPATGVDRNSTGVHAVPFDSTPKSPSDRNRPVSLQKNSTSGRNLTKRLVVFLFHGRQIILVPA